MGFLEIADDIYVNTEHISKIYFDRGVAEVEIDCKSSCMIDDPYYVREVRAFVNRNEWRD